MTFTRRKGHGRHRAVMFIAGCLSALVVAGSCGTSPPATAEPSPAPALTVYEEPCNRIQPLPSYEANAVALYAEHEFQGVAALELAARVTVVTPVKYAIGAYDRGVRLDRFDEALLVRDGGVAVVCSIQNEPFVTFNNVTFLFR